MNDNIPTTIYNHISRKECDEIKFLELYFNVKLKWYQKVYLELFLSLHRNKDKNYEAYDIFLKMIENSKERRSKSE